MNEKYLAGWLCVAAVAVSSGFTGASAQQQDASIQKRLEASPRHHEWVELKTRSGKTVRGCLAFPEVSRPVPGVIVIHENRGLTDWVRGVADQLAEAGYVALAPDLLSSSNKGGTAGFASGDAAREGIYRLKPEEVMEDLDACAAHLRSLDATNKKVAVAGFCWGGGQAFNYAVHNPDLAAVFVFYGSGVDDPGAIRRIKAPVYGFYGGNDQRITGQVPRIEKAMKEAGKKYVPVTYKDAGHGFMRSGEESAGRPADREGREKAWQRWKDLLKELEVPATATRPADTSPG